MILEKVRAVEDIYEFIQVATEWLRFFRRHHYQLIINPDLVNLPQPTDTLTPTLSNDEGVLIDQINENTLYFRIPTFYYSDRENLDKIIEENITKIKSAENLIIDLRNNPGGFSSYPLLEFLYTNPMRFYWETEVRVSPAIIQMFFDLSQGIHAFWDYLDEDTKEVMKQYGSKFYELTKGKEGKFVKIDINEADMGHVPIIQGFIIYDKVWETPNNIGIIVNRNTGSASEHYAIIAKQSRKVKIFGEPTAGAVDTAFMGDESGWAESPCGEIKMQFSEIRYSYLPDIMFDDIGIQPDFLIDSSVPDYRWVEHVSEIMSNWVSEPEPVRKRRWWFW
jgi:hypothetical protein